MYLNLSILDNSSGNLTNFQLPEGGVFSRPITYSMTMVISRGAPHSFTSLRRLDFIKCMLA